MNTAASPSVVFLDQTARMGGAEHSLLDIARVRRDSGHEDRVILFEDGELADRLRTAGVAINVCRTPDASTAVRRDSAVLRQAFSIVGLYRHGCAVAREAAGADVLYANTMKAFVVGCLAARRLDIPLIFHLRDIVSTGQFSRVNRSIISTACRIAKVRVIANSTATAATFTRLVGPRVDVEVIYNGIDSEPYDRAHAEAKPRDTVRGRVVGLFGRLAPWKGQHVAIEAVRELPDVELWLVGSALFGEDEYADRLKRIVGRLGLTDRVRFWGHRSDVPRRMQACDVIAHTSVEPEPFGRVVVEAMLSRRPVVAADAGGPREILQHGRTGWLHQPGNAQNLAATLRLAIRDCNHDKVEAAYREAKDRFSLPDRIADIDRIIAEAAPMTCAR